MLYTKNLIARLHQYIRSSDKGVYSGSPLYREVEFSMVDALPDCVLWHKNQFRDDGEPYYLHPVRVAAYTSCFINNYNEILVRNIALLHDVLEDTKYPEKDMRTKFGDFVTDHVINLTNEFTKDKYPALNRKARKQKELERLAGCDELTKQIKLCDRLDNISKNKIATSSNYLRESYELVDVLGESNPQLKQVLLEKMNRYGSTKSKKAD